MKKTSKKLSLYEVMQKKVDDESILLYCVDPESKIPFGVCYLPDELVDRDHGFDLVNNLLAHQIKVKDIEGDLDGDIPLAYISEYINCHLDTFKTFTEKYSDNHLLICFDYLDMFHHIINGRLTNEEYFELYEMLNK